MILLIADTFSDSLGRLTGDEQKAVKTTAFDLQPRVHEPHVKYLRAPVWEMRLSGRAGIARALYAVASGGAREIDLALRRAQDLRLMARIKDPHRTWSQDAGYRTAHDALACQGHRYQFTDHVRAAREEGDEDAEGVVVRTIRSATYAVAGGSLYLPRMRFLNVGSGAIEGTEWPAR